MPHDCSTLGFGAHHPRHVREVAVSLRCFIVLGLVLGLGLGLGLGFGLGLGLGVGLLASFDPSLLGFVDHDGGSNVQTANGTCLMIAQLLASGHTTLVMSGR